MTHPHPDHHDPNRPMIGGFEGVSSNVSDDEIKRLMKPTLTEQAGNALAWLIGALFALIIVGGLLWAVVSIWKAIPW